MNLQIVGHHLDVTPAMREYVLTRIARFKDRFTGAVTVVVRFCGKKKNSWAQSVRVEFHMKGRKVIGVTESLSRTVDSFYSSINRALESICFRLEQYATAKTGKSHRHERTFVRKSKESMAFT